MNDDMNELEYLIWVEKRFGPLQKTIPGGFSMDKADAIQTELTSLLQKYQKQLGIKEPLPRIRVWTTEDKLNFLFFDKSTGKRVLLGSWLSGEETYHEH